MVRGVGSLTRGGGGAGEYLGGGGGEEEGGMYRVGGERSVSGNSDSLGGGSRLGEVVGSF